MKHRLVSLAMLLTLCSSAAGLAAPSSLQTEKTLPLDGEVFLVEGRTAFIIPANAPTPEGPNGWVWYAPTLPNLPGKAERWMFERFLEAGIAIAGIDVGESYGSPEGNRLFTAFYREMTKARGYAPRPVLLGRSRGGLMNLSWAAAHPASVAAFAGIYPVSNLASYPGTARAAGAYGLTADELERRLTEYNPVDRLAGLAKEGVPLFAIHGDVDRVVPLEANSGLVKERYTALGGSMRLIVPSGQGHNMWPGFFLSQELVDFVIQHAHRGPRRPSERGPVGSSLAGLRWLAGSWRGRKGTTDVEEHWIEPRGRLMLGLNRSVNDAGKASFEFLRIAATPEGVTYFASPGGRPPTPFRLTALSENQATFENDENDFPQRIRYQREGDRLRARIEGRIDGRERSMEWLWQRTTRRSGE